MKYRTAIVTGADIGMGQAFTDIPIATLQPYHVRIPALVITSGESPI